MVKFEGKGARSKKQTGLTLIATGAATSCTTLAVESSECVVLQQPSILKPHVSSNWALNQSLFSLSLSLPVSLSLDHLCCASFRVYLWGCAVCYLIALFSDREFVCATSVCVSSSNAQGKLHASTFRAALASSMQKHCMLDWRGTCPTYGRASLAAGHSSWTTHVTCALFLPSILTLHGYLPGNMSCQATLAHPGANKALAAPG